MSGAELVSASQVTIQFFIPSHAKKRYSPGARVYRGMPLAGGRNTAASNIRNIDRQTSFRAVRRRGGSITLAENTEITAKA